MNETKQTNRRTPQSIEALEQRAEERYGTQVRHQIGLRRLIIVTNLFGIALAIILATNGMAIGYAITVGVVCGFFLPILVLIYICIIELKEYYFGKRIAPLASELRKPKPVKSPFDD